MIRPEFRAPGLYVAILMRGDKVRTVNFEYPGEGQGQCSVGVSAAGFLIEVLKRRPEEIVCVVPSYIFGNKCERIMLRTCINKGCK
jgi:hypothetical protein